MTTTKLSPSTQINTKNTVTRSALQQRIRRLARKHGHIAYQEGLIMVVIGDTTSFLLCLGDDDADLPRVQQIQAVQWLRRLLDRGIQARIVWPRDWPEVQRLIVTGDWRN